MRSREKAWKLLQELGLSEYEAKAYVALVASNPAGAYAVAQSAGLPTSKIYQIMDKLQRRGMVARLARRESRATLYQPVSTQRFARDITDHYSRVGLAVSMALKEIEQAPEDQLIWNLEGWEQTRARALSVVNEAENYLLVSGWPDEVMQIDKEVRASHARGCKVAVVHYGDPAGSWPFQVYTHRQERIVERQHHGRTLCLTADMRCALIANFAADGLAGGGFSTHQSFVQVVEDFIRHDIYFLKVMRRLAAELVSRFGEELELLRDPFTDREFSQRGSSGEESPRRREGSKKREIAG